MGIDVYLRWEGMTDEDRDRQMTGFDITAGAVGYLREAYFAKKNLYGTQVMFKECWESADCEHEYPAEVLRERLPEVLMVVAEKYDGDPWKERAMQAYIDFVSLADKKQAETGKPCLVYVSY